MIQDGAKLVQDTDDILEELRPDIRRSLSPRTTGEEDISTGGDRLEGDERIVFDLLAQRGALDADRLVGLARLPAHRVTAALVSLEIKGRVRVFAAGVYAATKVG